MKKNSFDYSIKCEFIILSDSLNSIEITERLQTIPDRSYNKGEVFVSKTTGKKGFRPKSLWSIISSFNFEEIEMGQCLKNTYDFLMKNQGNLKSIKENLNIEFIISISIKTDDAGYGFDLYQNDFINFKEFIDRVSISFLSINS